MAWGSILLEISIASKFGNCLPNAFRHSLLHTMSNYSSSIPYKPPMCSGFAQKLAHKPTGRDHNLQAYSESSRSITGSSHEIHPMVDCWYLFGLRMNRFSRLVLGTGGMSGHNLHLCRGQSSRFERKCTDIPPSAERTVVRVDASVR